MQRVETAVAVLATLAVVALHVVHFRHAGALWRDEAGAVQLAQVPTFGEMYERFPHEAFPLVFPCALRSYIALFGDGDCALRLMGMLVGLAIVGALWLNARSAGTVPLVSIVLLGFHPYFLYFGDSLRGYGLGTLLILLTFGAFARLVARPDRRTIAAATVLALLSVHCLLHNAAMLLGIGTAAAAVGLLRRRWRVTAASLGIGIAAALSLLPYRGPLTAARQWDVLLTEELGAGKILRSSLAALASPSVVIAWIWLALVVAAVVMTFSGRTAAGQDVPESRGASDLHLFRLLAIPAAMASEYALFVAVRYVPRMWYLLPLMALIASALDGLLASAARSPALRTLRLAVPVLLGAIALPATANEATIRMTNVDLVARRMTSAARRGDLILVDEWYYGVSFHRYYRGVARWMTVPDLPDHRFHRYDLVKAQMTSLDPLYDVIRAARRTLRSGHTVWWVTGFKPPPAAPLPVGLPPAPRAASRWADGPYYHLWSQQVGDFLRRHTRRQADLRVAPRKRVSGFEYLTIRRFQQWQVEPSQGVKP